MKATEALYNISSFKIRLKIGVCDTMMCFMFAYVEKFRGTKTRKLVTYAYSPLA